MSWSNYLSPFQVQTLSPSQEAENEENSLSLTDPKRHIVEMSIFYIILIDPLPESLAVDITETNTLSNDKTIPKDKLTFAHLKELILIATKRTSPTVYRRIHEVKSLWKIENLVEGKDKWGELEEIAKEENDIEQKLRNFGGVKLISSNLVGNIFPNYDFPEEHVHIIVTVEPPPPATTGPSQQNVPQVALEPDEIFKNFLKSHGKFLETYIENNDPLPPYKSKISLKTEVPATLNGDRPSLLLHDLPSSDVRQAITQVSSIQSAMGKAKNNLLVLLGTSGCGKTRSCYELLCHSWGLYFIASRKGNGGSDDIEVIENHIRNDLTEDWEENRSKVDHITRCAILSRFLILNYCTKLSPTMFNPQRWLLLQACQKIFGKLYSYSGDIFSKLMLQLVYCTRNSVINHINNMYQEFCQNHNFSNVFSIILDEAQAFETVLKGKFRSRYDQNKQRSLISPIIQTFKKPTSSFSNHCAIACGTGLGLLSLGETLGSLGIAKPDLDVDKFTNFGRWRDIAHVKEYVGRLVELTDDEYNKIYERFRGRFRPIASIVEEVLKGKSISDAVDGLWTILTCHRTDEQSLYKHLHDIIDRDRPNHVLSKNVLDLYKCLTLCYYYSGSPYLCTDDNQFKIVESGFGCFRTVKPPTSSELEQICNDEVTLQTLSVNKDALYPAIPGEDILVAYIDEPFALTASYNFFNDTGELDNEILKIMSLVNNSSSWGTLWQTYLPKEFEQMFDGQIDIRNMPIFAEVAKNYDLPPFCIGSPSIVKSSDETIPLIKNATSGYTLNEFFSEPSEQRPAFFIPDDRCGPDIIFFVKFEEVEVPVFVQVKLRYAIKTIVGALSTIDPNLLYQDENGNLFQKELNEPIVKKIKQRCEHGSIGLLVAYPADVFQESFVSNHHSYDLRNQSSQQLIGIIDYENASMVFQRDHLKFLDTLKDTTRKKEANVNSEEVGGSGPRKKQKKSEKVGGSRSRKKQKRS